MLVFEMCLPIFYLIRPVTSAKATRCPSNQLGLNRNEQKHISALRTLRAEEEAVVSGAPINVHSKMSANCILKNKDKALAL